MANLSSLPPLRQQQGLALFTALMLLLVVTIIGISSVRTGVMQSQMSSNEELRIAAFQTTESILDAVFANSKDNFVITGGLGASNCTDNWPLNSDDSDPCTVRNIVLPEPLNDTVADSTKQLMVNITRMPPLCVPCPLSSIVKDFKCASFRVDARYDGTTTGQGRTQLLEGVQMLTFNCKT